jgi:ribosomal protein S4
MRLFNKLLMGRCDEKCKLNKNFNLLTFTSFCNKLSVIGNNITKGVVSMKKQIKGFILGSAITGILMLSFTGFAEGIMKTIQAIENGVNIKVNGKAVNTPSYLINDATYVSLRAIGEMLGKNVIWDGNTNTANINDKDYVEPKEEVKIIGQKFMNEGNKTYNTCAFSDGYIVSLTLPKGSLFTKEFVSICALNPNVEKIDKNINIIGFSDTLGEKYYPLPVTTYAKDTNTDIEFYKSKDFFERLKTSDNNVYGLVFYDSYVNLEGIEFDDGAHKCKLYLQDK